MSQKKMEAYKEAKKNVKETRKKEKRNRILAWIGGILAAALVIGASVFLIYYTEVIKPEKEKAATEAEASADSDNVDIVNAVGDALQGTADTAAQDAASDDAAASEGADAAQEAPAEEAPAEDAAE